MKKVIIGVVIVALIALFGGRAMYLHKQNVAEKDMVKIGALVPISGPLAFGGERVMNALKLLEEKMNATRDIKVKFVFEDDKFTAKDSIAAFRKLRSQGINLYFVFGDVPGKAIVALAEEQKIPLFAMAESTELNTSPVVVNISPTSHDWANSMADFVNDILKPQNVVIIYPKDVGHIELTEHLKTKFKNTIPVVHEKQFTPNSMEVRSIVAKALNDKPELVIVTGYGSTYVAILNTLREQGFTGPIVSDVNISAVKKNLVKTPYPLYWTDTIFDDNTDIPEIEQFLHEYEARYQDKPSTLTMLGYVGAQALINTIQSTDYNPMDVLNKIQQTKNLDTLLGPVTIDTSKYMKLPLVIKQMQHDGTTKIVKE